MSAPIISPTRESANLSDFDTRHHIDARFAGGTIVADTDFIDWIGRTVVRVAIPALTLHLYPHEARDLAAALQALAVYVDEEAQ